MFNILTIFKLFSVTVPTISVVIPTIGQGKFAKSVSVPDITGRSLKSVIYVQSFNHFKLFSVPVPTISVEIPTIAPGKFDIFEKIFKKYFEH
jgi:hypothetical protein